VWRFPSRVYPQCGRELCGRGRWAYGHCVHHADGLYLCLPSAGTLPMTTNRRPRDRRLARGVTLIELVVVIVLLAVLGVGFMAMYADVSRRSAVADQIAP